MEFPGDLLRSFPNLTPNNAKVTSQATARYNCVAWAAADTERWWWPDADGDGYWPADAARVETVESFVAAFATLGFARCKNGDFEVGFEKIAIFANANTPTHAARQLATGKWTSKLGGLEDIEHDHPSTLAGDVYGNVVCFLKRAK